MSPPFQESLDPCLEKAGFLFAHDCPRPAAQQCARCAKPICIQHGHPVESGEVLCTTCLKQEGMTGSGSDPDTTQEGEENPYLYSSYYYQDHGYYGPGSWGHELLHDPNDFTEADGASLRAKVKHHFEEDMGGS
ncbi:hypothetical protein F0U60_42205 [Archangium minus]|uniref:Uncharacterized protein n=1 Tax=Archangium minus TaxID=83450 RepID=A0ABY9X3L9_9BACT|nr:hypothetical protein F0U60_42205 [Archangium minus]